MNKTVETCLNEYEENYVRSPELDYFSNQYSNIIKSLDKNTANKLQKIVDEMQIIQQKEYFEAGFAYGENINKK